MLTHQMEGRLHERGGKAPSNFNVTLPEPQSDLARETIKDPYVFDFLTIRDKHDEKELENALVNQVTSFLLELGSGFSFIGRQRKITVDVEDFYIDLLFYHVKLHCYVVVELKSVKFKPEFAGKLNFYVSAVDGILKTEEDNPTVGILICKSKKKTVVEYALKDMWKPIGVSEYQITQALPDELRPSLPSVEDIEAFRIFSVCGTWDYMTGGCDEFLTNSDQRCPKVTVTVSQLRFGENLLTTPGANPGAMALIEWT